MNNRFFSNSPVCSGKGLAVIRIITGALMVYHGAEIFNAAHLREYAHWEPMKKLPSPLLMVHIGKGIELLTGICFILGIFTRLAALPMAANMLFICFYVGNGKFYYEDQHPFIFALLAMVFFFTGPGALALEKLFSKTPG